MKYLSLYSGIEAATVAWKPLGWTPVAFAEIEPFCNAVLDYHYPEIPNLENMEELDGREKELEGADVLIFGSPCQSFSVAGGRLGLDDPRGNLALITLGVVKRMQYKPRWIVFENVTGLLSSWTDVEAGPPSEEQKRTLRAEGLDPEDFEEVEQNSDFDAFLSALEECGYGWAYRTLDAQYVRVDGFGRAVPQRRRRVFVVGYLGDWRPPFAVLFEPKGMCGDTPPGRKTGEEVAHTLKGGSSEPSWHGQSSGREEQNPVVDCYVGGRCSGELDVSTAVNHGGSNRLDFESETFVYENHGQDSRIKECGDVGPTVHKKYGTGGNNVPIVFDTTQITSKTNRSNPDANSPCHTLAKDAQPPLLVAAVRTAQTGANGVGVDAEVAHTLDAVPEAVLNSYVRRLTPVECERLMGFPDNYTRIPWKGKPAEQCPDSHRYKALGNSMAVSVVRWIGGRIQLFEDAMADFANSVIGGR